MVKTVTLTAGTPQTVAFSESYPFYWIDNKTSGDVYASVGTPEPDTDGTYTIAAGSQLRISGAFSNGLSLLGEGKVQIIASGIAECPFKSAAKGGGSSEYTGTIDSGLSSTSTNPVQNKVVYNALNKKSNTNHTHSLDEIGADASGAADAALSEAKSYTDTEIAGLINGAPSTLDTLDKIAKAMEENQDVVDALDAAIGSKANESDLTAHINDTTKHITAAERIKWDAAEANVIDTIKVNGAELVPEGKSVNIVIPDSGSGGGITIDSELSDTSENPVQNKVINEALSKKAPSEHEHRTSDITDFPTSLPAHGGDADTAVKLVSSSFATVTIDTSDWTANPNGGYIYKYVLPIPIPCENFIFDVKLSTDQSTAKLQLQAWSCIIADGNITQEYSDSDGVTTSFTFYAFTTQPSVALTVGIQGVS